MAPSDPLHADRHGHSSLCKAPQLRRPESGPVPAG